METATGHGKERRDTKKIEVIKTGNVEKRESPAHR
jgi:hypothetical protein